MRNIGLLLVGVLLFILNSCDTEPKFNIKGNIKGAEGKMIYFESSDLEGIIPLDSMKLESSGNFEFMNEKPESPEFYRLRIEDKIINLSIDSVETIIIDAPYEGFSTDYTVIGSENSSKIKELTLLQINLQNQVGQLLQNSNKLDNQVFEDSLSNIINNYKDTVKMNYIFIAPNKTYAYFALFQKVGDYLIFDPFNNKDDIKCFAAVATSLNNMYPHADRSKNLYNMVIKGMKNTRSAQQKTIEVPEVSETGVVEITLKDIKGNIRKLTDLKGKVVLLDFTIYQSAVSTPHNYMLLDLYNKYVTQGLEIYQVSLDADEHFWKTVSDNLPWVCVRDENGVYSTAAAIYNVKQLPTYFLINRNNELSDRDENIKNIEEAIKKLL